MVFLKTSRSMLFLILSLILLNATVSLGRAESAPQSTTAPDIATLGDIAAQPSITIYRNSSRYNSFPDIKRLPDGRLLCVFRDAAYPEHIRHIEADARIVGCVSKDHGRSWSEPTVIYDGPECQNDPSVAVLNDGRLLLTFFNWVGRSGDYVRKHKPPYARKVSRGQWGEYAEPDGVYRLWGDAKDLTWNKEPIRLAGSNTILRATSASTIQTKEGTILLPMYGRSKEWESDIAYVLRSTDGGRTWSREIMIAKDSNAKVSFQEPALVEAGNGDIVALMRTTNAEDHLYCSRSSDDGRTWLTALRTPLVGHPADLKLLPGGNLLAVYGYRHELFGVRACVSVDHGKSWDPKKEIVIAASGVHGDLGYPSACLTEDGHVVVAYYMNGKGTKDRWIECKRIPLSRFMR